MSANDTSGSENNRAFKAILFIVAIFTLSIEAGMHTHVGAASRTILASPCPVLREVKTSVVLDHEINPAIIHARLCDQVVFKNLSHRPMVIAFGSHNAHIKYPNLDEISIPPAKELIFTLTAKGIYAVHNHDNERANGIIEIAE